MTDNYVGVPSGCVGLDGELLLLVHYRMMRVLGGEHQPMMQTGEK